MSYNNLHEIRWEKHKWKFYVALVMDILSQSWKLHPRPDSLIWVWKNNRSPSNPLCLYSPIKIVSKMSNLGIKFTILNALGAVSRGQLFVPLSGGWGGGGGERSCSYNKVDLYIFWGSYFLTCYLVLKLYIYSCAWID